MREIQGFVEAMPSSWTSEMDGGSNLLQRDDSTGALNDKCSCGRHTDEQDRRRGIQSDRGDGVEQLPVVKRARLTQEGWR